MTLLSSIFYIYSAIAIASAVMVVISSNPVRGTLFLVLTFVAMSGIWLLLQAEFLALILILVYVGAVMTLFLFVVMMLRVNVVSLKEGFVRFLPFSILIVLMMFGLTVMVVRPEHIPPPPLAGPEVSNIANLGMVLYTHFAYPFELAAVILLAAIVAAISLTHRKPSNRKIQNPSQQIETRREDRIRLIKMPSAKKIKPSGMEG